MVQAVKLGKSVDQNANQAGKIVRGDTREPNSCESVDMPPFLPEKPLQKRLEMIQLASDDRSSEREAVGATNFAEGFGSPI